MLKDRRIRIIIGHYGSGKTEFSVNYALKLNDLGKKVALADLDVVNLYFRSREKAQVLEEAGIKIISSSIKASSLDIPSISAEILSPLQNKSYDAILDIGGDPAGARVLGRYKEYLSRVNCDIFFVLNANRPETNNVQKIMEYMLKIEDVARAKITGIVNNTHLLKSTSIEDVLRGYEIAMEISKKTGLAIKYNAVLESIADQLPHDLEGEIFPIRLYMREDWML